VPAYNEAEGILEFHRRLSAMMGRLGRWEVVYVNDGSRDLTLTKLSRLQERAGRVAVVNLSRNFGKEIAITTGLDHALGRAVILMDSGLQHPPEVFPELVAAWREGYDMVFAKRRSREGESWLRRSAANAFYGRIARTSSTPIPRDGGDFRLLSRRAVDAVLRLREQYRFMKGLFAWIGFLTKAVLFDVEPRYAGKSAWTYVGRGAAQFHAFATVRFPLSGASPNCRWCSPNCRKQA
jgi:glycosyltransferase involved in cell wall biosynthesis